MCIFIHSKGRPGGRGKAGVSEGEGRGEENKGDEEGQ